MVLAARTLRIPAALSEADAVFGLANRLAAPFARRVYLAYPLDGLDGEKYRVVGRPIPARARRVPKGGRARSSSCRRTSPCCSWPARSPVRSR